MSFFITDCKTNHFEMTSKTYVVGKVEKETPPHSVNRETQPTHYTTASQPSVQPSQMTQSHSIPISTTSSSSSNANNIEKGYNSATQQNQVGNVILAGVPIVSLFIDSKERLCLAQISNTLLSK